MDKMNVKDIIIYTEYYRAAFRIFINDHHSCYLPLLDCISQQTLNLAINWIIESYYKCKNHNPYEPLTDLITNGPLR